MSERLVHKVEQPVTLLQRLSPSLADGDPEALQELATALTAAGGPLVEPTGSPGVVHVSFVWLTERSHETVRLATGLDPSWPYPEMKALPGGRVWLRSYLVRGDVRTTYQFVVDPPLFPDVLDERDDGLLDLAVGLAACSFADPFNADRFAFELPHATIGPANDTSVLALPDAPAEPWLFPPVPDAAWEEHTVHSTVLGNVRRAWTLAPLGRHAAATPLVVLLDGAAFRYSVPTDAITANLAASGAAPPVAVVLLDNPTFTSRAEEFTCHPPFADFLADEVVPWASEALGIAVEAATTVIGGVSYGGLAAAFVGLRRPDTFGNVLAMSPSCWWGPDLPDGREWLTRELGRLPRADVRFHVEVGLLEDAPNDRAGVSMVDTNRRLHSALVDSGCDVSYTEFAGGHEFASWRGSLARGVSRLLGPRPGERRTAGAPRDEHASTPRRASR